MQTQKKQFQLILAIATVLLLIMPLFMLMNDSITRLVISLDYYRFIQDYIIPWELRMVAVILAPFGLQPVISGEYLRLGGANGLLLEIAWNCIGWQSLLFFLVTSWIGLQGGKYTVFSKFKAWAIGLLGTFLINLLRISFVSLIAYYVGSTPALFFHDYGSVFSILGWLLFFWWFSYRYLLEPKIRLSGQL